MGLDRIPGGVNEPTKADTRWVSRQAAWDQALDALSRWQKISAKIDTLPLDLVNGMAEHIASNTIGTGHYSIWMKVFKGEPMVLDQIDKIYKEKGLYKEYDSNGNRTVRTGGNI